MNLVPSLIDQTFEKDLQRCQSKYSDRNDSAGIPHHRFRFYSRHLLGLMASVAIAMAALSFAIEHFGATITTVEIINYHPTWEPSGSVEFLVQLPNGFSQSAVSVPTNLAIADYSKLVGRTFPLRYHAHRVLWFPPEDPTIAAYRLVQAKVKQFGVNLQHE